MSDPIQITVPPYMGAKAHKKELCQAIFADKKNQRYAYSQVKMDGRYADTIVSSGTVKLESRAGNITHLDGAKFIEELKKFSDCVLNGELTIDNVSRHVSNGIIASLVSIGGKKKSGIDVTSEIKEFEKERKITYQKALDSIRLTVWDTITIQEYKNRRSNVPYHDRLVNLSNLLKASNPTLVSFIRSKKVYSYADALKYFQELIKDGEEGTILKASMGLWVDDKPVWQVKIKVEMNVDLRIIGFNYGTGKNSKVISTVNAESSDGLLVTCPSGIKEKEMRYITDNMDKLMGTIIEVKCNGLSHDSAGNYSLLSPAYKQRRDDKMTCDSLQMIKDIEAGLKGL